MRLVAAILFLALLATGSPAADVPRDITLSIYQGPCADGDFAANLAVVKKVIAQAKDRKSDFVCFPETFLSGYTTREEVAKASRSLDDADIQSLIRSTADHELVVLVGLARKSDAGLMNSMLIMHRGKLLGVYDKVLLTGGDSQELGFTPGKSIPVFEAHGVKFAAIICHDTSFLAPAYVARLKGARLLFTPHYNRIGRQSVDEHRRHVRNCHIALAGQLHMVVARSNVTVTNVPDEVGYGDSFILDPQGNPLAETRLFRTEFLTTRVPAKLLHGPTPWASDDELPRWLKEELRELLKSK